LPEAPLTYLDHAATSPLRPEAAAAMAAARAGPLGNPTGSHPAAQRARRILEEARDEVAGLLDRAPSDIVFTSGGTESDNLAVAGTVRTALARSDAAVGVVSSAVEHPAVREACRAAARDDRVTWVETPVDGAGVVDIGALADGLGTSTVLVAVMLANNETGTVQPLEKIVDSVRARCDAAVLTDAVQAAPFLPLEMTSAADMVSLSAHKVGGPVGVGVLAVSASVELTPVLWGGGQERTRRSGTQDVVGAAGMAAALGAACVEREAAAARVGALRDRLAHSLLRALPTAVRTVPAGTEVLPGHLHLCLPGVDREELLVVLAERGVCASGGSSCASGALEPSHVLASMGVEETRARGAVRFSLGPATVAGDVERAAALVVEAVASLRRDL